MVDNLPIESRGLFDALAEELVQPFKGKGTKRPKWQITSERPGLVLSSTRFLVSSEQEPSEECLVVVRDDASSLDRPGETVKGYYRSNQHVDAYYASGKYKAVKEDALLLLSEQLPRDEEKRDNILRAFRIQQSVDYQLGKAGKLKQVVSKVELVPLIRPRFSPCLPLPSKGSEWRCIASGATWQALLSLSKAFGGSRPPLVLVTGPPGCGKEAYAGAVHYGRCRRPNCDSREAFRTISLAEVAAESLHRELELAFSALNPKYGTLFLDEVDKPDKALRSSLLRVLESRSLRGDDGTEISCKNVTIVMAAGKILSELRQCEPPDFWTRMEVHIPVQDPLIASSQWRRESLLREFFLFFWWDAVSGWVENLLARKKGQQSWGLFFENDAYCARLAHGVFGAAVGEWVAEDFDLRPSESVLTIAEEFASVLAPHLERRQLSVRGLRSAVNAVLLATRAPLLAMAIGTEPEHEKAAFVAEARKAIHDAIGTVLQVLPA